MRTESEIREMRSEILAGAVGASEDAFAGAMIAAGVLAWAAGDQQTLNPFGDGSPSSADSAVDGALDEIATVIAGWRDGGGEVDALEDIESILGPKTTG